MFSKPLINFEKVKESRTINSFTQVQHHYYTGVVSHQLRMIFEFKFISKLVRPNHIIKGLSSFSRVYLIISRIKLSLFMPFNCAPLKERRIQVEFVKYD